jgi:hypothetical protein
VERSRVTYELFLRVLPSMHGSWLFLQTLDLARKACLDKHSSLLRLLIRYGRKKSFITLTPVVNVKKLFRAVIYEFL